MSVTGKASRGRASVTNRGPTMHRYGRDKLAVARRVRDLYLGHLARLGEGPHDAVTAAHALRAAELAVIAEELRQRMLAGEAIDPDVLTRLEGGSTRAERAMIEAAPADNAAERDLNELLAKYRAPTATDDAA